MTIICQTKNSIAIIQFKAKNQPPQTFHSLPLWQIQGLHERLRSQSLSSIKQACSSILDHANMTRPSWIESRALDANYVDISRIRWPLSVLAQLEKTLPGLLSSRASFYFLHNCFGVSSSGASEFTTIVLCYWIEKQWEEPSVEMDVSA